MRSPKIIFPKIFLLPRFGVDIGGKWLVSHSPVIRPRSGEFDHTQLCLFAAILNSSVAAWYVDLNGRKFGHGYNEVGISLLRRFPVPDLGSISSSVLHRVVGYVKAILDNQPFFDNETVSELDDIVLHDLYGLQPDEISMLKFDSKL